MCIICFVLLCLVPSIFSGLCHPLPRSGFLPEVSLDFLIRSNHWSLLMLLPFRSTVVWLLPTAPRGFGYWGWPHCPDVVELPAVPSVSIRWHKMPVAGPIGQWVSRVHLGSVSKLQPASRGLHRRSSPPSLTGEMRPKEGEELLEAIQQVNSSSWAPSPSNRPFFCSVE